MLVAQTRHQLQTTRVGTPTQKCSCTGSLLKNGGGGAQLTAAFIKICSRIRAQACATALRTRPSDGLDPDPDLVLPGLLIYVSLAQDGNGLLSRSTTLLFALYQPVFPLPAPG